MRITSVKAENFRAHGSTEIPMGQLGCLIGENNAGKSSILHSIQFALEDRKVSGTDFKDPEQPIRVTLKFEGISDADLKRISDKHRDKVRKMIVGEKLTIVRTQRLGEKPDSGYLTSQPIDQKWNQENFEKAISGLRSSKLREAAISYLPELDPILEAQPTKAVVAEAFEKLKQGLPDDQLKEVLEPFPTGISSGVKPLYPSVIYIEAVKEASAEAKSTGSSAFSKLLELLLSEIEPEFEDMDSDFKSINEKLNGSSNGKSDSGDTRLSAIRGIESNISENLENSFPGAKVELKIPTPTLTMLFANASLLINNDGHTGEISTKGDGLKRTVLFSLLRTYTQIRDTGFTTTSDGKKIKNSSRPNRPYLLLFEEPELFLHPRAQRQLMSALSTFAHSNQVLVTTHAPSFFQSTTNGFTKLQKTNSGVKAYPVKLELESREAFQLITHENNEAAFFAHSVVLVEGDSDTFTFPHLAKLINKKWDSVEQNVMFIKIGGKGNISKYREFFKQFDVKTHVITDLDALVDGFNLLTDSSTIMGKKARLGNAIKPHMPEINTQKSSKAKEIANKRNAGELWLDAQVAFKEWREKKSDSSAIAISDSLSQLFDMGASNDKLEVIRSTDLNPISEMVQEIISLLAEEHTYVLRRGDLETYCGTGNRSNKVETAINFCQNTQDIEQFKEIHGIDGDSILQELTGIFKRIFPMVELSEAQDDS